MNAAATYPRGPALWGGAHGEGCEHRECCIQLFSTAKQGEHHGLV